MADSFAPVARGRRAKHASDSWSRLAAAAAMLIMLAATSSTAFAAQNQAELQADPDTVLPPDAEAAPPVDAAEPAPGPALPDIMDNHISDAAPMMSDSVLALDDTHWIQVRIKEANPGSVAAFHMVRQSTCRRRGRWRDEVTGCSAWLQRTGAHGPNPINSRSWAELGINYYLVPVCGGPLSWRAHRLMQASREESEVTLTCPNQ